MIIRRKCIIKNIFYPTLFFIFLITCGADANVSVDGALVYERTAKAGETYLGFIIIKNTSDEPQEAKIYLAYYLFFFDGKVNYGEPGKDPRSNANWITFSPHQPIIPANDNLEVRYTIKVPDNKSLSGTYWSLLMVEGISP